MKTTRHTTKTIKLKTVGYINLDTGERFNSRQKKQFLESIKKYKTKIANKIQSKINESLFATMLLDTLIHKAKHLLKGFKRWSLFQSLKRKRKEIFRFCPKQFRYQLTLAA